MLRRLFQAWRLLNLPCEGISELISRSLDERCPMGERLAYRSHLVYCVACRRYRRQLLLMRRAIQGAESPDDEHGSEVGPSLPEAVRDRIKRALKER